MLEEDNVVGGKAKVVVLLEKGDSGGAGGARGHDVPGDGDIGNSTGLLLGELLELEDALGLDLEERLVGGEVDVVATLGSRRAKTGALATCEKDDGDLVLADLVQTNVPPLLGLVLGGLEDRVKALFGQGSQGGGLVVEHGRRAGGGLLVNPVDTFDVQGLQLGDELGLVVVVEVVVKVEEVTLTGSLVALDELTDIVAVVVGGVDAGVDVQGCGRSSNHIIVCLYLLVVGGYFVVFLPGDVSDVVALSSCLLGNWLMVVGGYMLLCCCVMRKCVDEEEMMRKGKELEEREALLICTLKSSIEFREYYMFNILGVCFAVVIISGGGRQTEVPFCCYFWD